MTSTEYLVGFIIAAALVPTIILGGMTSAYFLGKRRVDAPHRPAGHARETATAGGTVHRQPGGG